MGSGTTLVEALASGAQFTGIDTDPLARLIAQAKSGEASSDELLDLSDELKVRWKVPARRLTPPMPDVANFGHWFPLESWAWLQSLFAAILGLQCSDEARRFLLVVFSSILRRVSSADDQSQKTYVSGTLRKSPPAVRETFWKSLTKAIAGLQDLERCRSATGTARIPVRGDARALPVRNGSIDLVVTSPPYLDSVDYMYNMMLEYFWLGRVVGVPTRAVFNRMRREAIGAKNPIVMPTAQSEMADLLVSSGLSRGRERAALAYFDGMGRHFAEAARCLKSDGRYVMVVGNSATRESIVPVHDGLVRLALNAGLSVERIFGYRIRRHYMKFPRGGRGGIILLDWVIVLHRQPTTPQTGGRLSAPWLSLKPNAVAN